MAPTSPNPPRKSEAWESSLTPLFLPTYSINQHLLLDPLYLLDPLQFSLCSLRDAECRGLYRVSTVQFKYLSISHLVTNLSISHPVAPSRTVPPGVVQWQKALYIPLLSASITLARTPISGKETAWSRGGHQCYLTRLAPPIQPPWSPLSKRHVLSHHPLPHTLH